MRLVAVPDGRRELEKEDGPLEPVAALDLGEHRYLGVKWIIQNNSEFFSQNSEFSANFWFVFANLIEKAAHVTIFWNLARNPEKNSSKIRRKKCKIRFFCDWINEFSLIQSQKIRILQIFLRIFDEFFSGFRAKFKKIVTCAAFSIKFAKTNQNFAENFEFCENYSLLFKIIPWCP